MMNQKRKLVKNHLVIFSLVMLIVSCSTDHVMQSPGKSVEANISNVQGALSFDLTYNNELIIPNLKLDFIHNEKSLLENVSILKVEKTHINEE